MSFLAITTNNKAFLYKSDNSIPLKSFKFKTREIIDAQMPSPKMLFTITKEGEIKLFNVNFEQNAISVSGQMKIDVIVNKMEVFHNNERLLIVNCVKNGENMIYIINVKTKKVVNIMKFE